MTTTQYRASEINDPWEPDFDRLTKRDARGYVNAELRAAGRRSVGLRVFWTSTNVIDGKTPEQMLDEGRYEEVWRFAVSQRGQNGG